MKTYRYRDHRGSLTASLETTIRVVNLEALRDHLNEGLLDSLTPQDKIEFKRLSVSERVWSTSPERWETHLVTLAGCAIGYSDGVIPEEAEDMFDTTQYQVEIDGVATNVSELSDVVQLRQHLCAAMETIERIDAATSGTLSIIDDFRTDKIKPMKLIDLVIAKVQDAAEFLEGSYPTARGRFTIAYDKLISAIDQLKAAKKEAD